jgi:hypothetical protein
MLHTGCNIMECFLPLCGSLNTVRIKVSGFLTANRPHVVKTTWGRCKDRVTSASV